MLREHVERAGAETVGVAFARFHGVQCGLRFEIFEAVARHAQRAARFVEPVVGATDALEQPRRALGSAHRSEEHTSELQTLMSNSYAELCFQNKNESHVTSSK